MRLVHNYGMNDLALLHVWLTVSPGLACDKIAMYMYVVNARVKLVIKDTSL